MSSPAFGYEEYVGIGFEETAYNTVADFTDAASFPCWFRVVENSLVIDHKPMPQQQASGFPIERYCGAAGGTPTEINGIARFSGTITIQIDPNMMGPILFNALRIPTTDETYYSVAGASPYVHTFTHIVVPETIGAVPSLTISRYNGQEQTTFSGCHINSLELSSTADGPILCKIEPIPAFYYIDSHPGGTPSFATGPILRQHESRILYHATAGTAKASVTSAISGVSSWTYTINNNLRLQPTAATGASGTDRQYHLEPIPGGYREFNFTMTKDWDSDTWQDLWKTIRAVAQFYAFRLELDSDTTGYSLNFYHPAMRLVDGLPPFGGDPGPVPETLNWQAAIWNTGAADQIGTVDLENDEDDYMP